MKKIITLFFILFFISFSVYAEGAVLETLAEDSVLYEELISSPRTILFFWTTWCPYCRKELMQLSKECDFSNNDPNILYINIGQSKSTVERFIDSMNIGTCTRGKIILDKTGYLAEKFSVSAIPTYIFLKDGKFRHRSYYFNEQIIEAVFKE